MPKRTRRTPEQMIKDLQEEIARIQERAAQAKLKKDPAFKQVSSAVRSLDKALDQVSDKDLASAIKDARRVLAEALEAAGGGSAGKTLQPRAKFEVEPEAIVAYLADNPDSSGEEVATALGCDTKTLRPQMKKLIAAKRVKTKGKARGMRYTATRS